MIVSNFNPDAVLRIINTKEKELDSKLVLEPMVSAINTDNGSTIEDSICLFRDAGDEFYDLSILGFINGILSELTGKVLAVQMDKDTMEIVGWAIKDKWWD